MPLGSHDERWHYECVGDTVVDPAIGYGSVAGGHDIQVSPPDACGLHVGQGGVYAFDEAPLGPDAGFARRLGVLE